MSHKPLFYFKYRGLVIYYMEHNLFVFLVGKANFNIITMEIQDRCRHSRSLIAVTEAVIIGD